MNVNIDGNNNGVEVTTKTISFKELASMLYAIDAGIEDVTDENLIIIHSAVNNLGVSISKEAYKRKLEI